jgi:putative SOS response-associated peptidase YedK
MCGRFTLKTPVVDWLLDLFPNQFALNPNLAFAGTSSNVFRARYNISPTQQILVLRPDTSGQLRVDQMRWGLIPHWAEDLSIGAKMINARSETLSEKPSFKPSLANKRCLVLADGYYEWKKISPKEKQPYWIHCPDEQPFMMAGLWAENRRIPIVSQDSCLLSATVITTASNQDTAMVHDRMPAIIQEPSAMQAWLNLDVNPAEQPSELLALLQPAPAGTLQLRRVSNAVGKPQNDFQELIESISD